MIAARSPTAYAANFASNRLNVSLESGLAAFGALEADWHRLVCPAIDENPFLAWEWVFTWAERMMGDRLCTAIVRDGDETVAIAPFYRNNYLVGPGVRARSLQLYGPRELQQIFELRQIPMAVGQEIRIVEALLAGLITAASWDWLEVGAYGPSEQAWREVLGSRTAGVTLVAQDHQQVPILELRETWEQQRSALRRNVKERIRRGYNSLKRDGVDFAVTFDSEPSRCRANLAELFALHEMRAEVRDRTEHGNRFQDQRIRAFLGAAAERLTSSGRLTFAKLETGGRTVASRILFERDTSTYLYYSGFDPQWWDHSVMTVVVTEAVKRAISCGHRNVNFSPGLDQFKTGWTEPEGQQGSVGLMIGRETPVARMRLSAFRRRKRLSAAAADLRSRVRRRLAR